MRLRYAGRAGYLAGPVQLALAALAACLIAGCQSPSAPPGTPQSSREIAASPSPIATGVDAEGARAALEAFLGRPVDVQVTGPETGASGPFYQLQGADISAAVSATDGRVVSILLLDAVPSSRVTKLSPADALTAATAYVEAHGLSVDGLGAGVELVDHGEAVAYEVTWTKVERGIELPVRTILQVDAATGAIFSFLDVRRPYAEPPAPVVSRELAVSAARIAAAMSSASVDGAKLLVSFTPDGRQQLVWEIALTDGVSHALVDVDAISGSAVVVGRG